MIKLSTPSQLDYMTIDKLAEIIGDNVPALAGHGLTSFLYNYICDEGTITVPDTDMVVTDMSKIIDILDSVEWSEFSDTFGGETINDVLFKDWRTCLKDMRKSNDALELSPYVMVVEW